MRIGIAQINPTVGDLQSNADKILAAYALCTTSGADLIITPELSLTGYPPRDLVFKSRFVPKTLEILHRLASEVGDVPLLVGFVDSNQSGRGNPFFNAAALLQKDRPPRIVHKTLLPTYDVFDEKRYFEPAPENAPLDFNGTRIGITICEDIWPDEYLQRPLYRSDPLADLTSAGATLALNLSASPFHLDKPRQRFEMISGLALKHGLPIVYCNAVGGNDQLLFDGNSIAVNARGECLAQLASFDEEIRVIDLSSPPIQPSFQEEPEELHDALVLGTRDYLAKCGFSSVVLGLSGGIDSAVTACIAAEAVGPNQVTGVAMPTRYSSDHSIADARRLAENLGIHFHLVPIEKPFVAFRDLFTDIFAGLPEDTTEENMQPRLRGMALMALSNKFGHLVLSTGNKSELAVGYTTLYGDMCGGLAVISDVPKTLIYRLAHYINRDREIIPLNTIEKPPSAELKPNQKDQDTLPPYEVLDEILHYYVEQQQSARDIIALGFDESVVRWVARRVDLNEYKRQQAPPGLRVTSKAFGQGRRMPIAHRFKD